MLVGILGTYGVGRIEAPRSKLWGIFDSHLVFFYFLLVNSEASSGQCARGNQKIILSNIRRNA